MKIDVHAHVYPSRISTCWMALVARRLELRSQGISMAIKTPEDLERRLATMYRAEVDIQVLSFSNGVHPKPRRC
jgi:hypothetical protein